jgi:hypothetical protein
MMVDKTHIQKVYEKLEMIRIWPEKLDIMLARDSSGRPELVLMVGTTPIASFLHEPNDLAPDFEKSEAIRELFRVAYKTDDRLAVHGGDDDLNTVSPEVRDVFDRAGYESIGGAW